MKISDIIENFIVETMGDDNSVELSRNELAEYFSCAPSQINYVLSTRFTLEKGYVIDSRRGGGGYIKIQKVNSDNVLQDIIVNAIGKELSLQRAHHITDRLLNEKVINDREAEIIKCMVADHTMMVPKNILDAIRASTMKQIVGILLKYS